MLTECGIMPSYLGCILLWRSGLQLEFAEGLLKQEESNREAGYIIMTCKLLFYLKP